MSSNSLIEVVLSCLIVAAFVLVWWLQLRLQKTILPTGHEPIEEPPQPPPPPFIKPIEKRKIILSAHAIDRASTRHIAVYLAYRKHPEDGLYSWLIREMKSLRASGQLRDGHNAIDHSGMLWAIVVSEEVVVLKSLSFKKGKHRRKKPLSKNQIEKLKRRKGNARMREN